MSYSTVTGRARASATDPTPGWSAGSPLRGCVSLEVEQDANLRRRLELVERFATGDGVDLDLIRDPVRTLRR